MHKNHCVDYNEANNESDKRLMRERFKRKQLSTVLGILVTIGLLVAVLLLHGIITAINSVLEFKLMEFVEYGILIIVGILIVRKWLTEYEYAVIDDELYIDRYIGSRPRRIFETKLGQVIYIGTEKPEDCKSKKRFTFRSGKKNVVYMVYIKNDEKQCAVFSPSDKMLKLIETRMVK